MSARLTLKFVTITSMLAAAVVCAPVAALAQGSAPRVYVAAYGGLAMPAADTFDTSKSIPDADGRADYKATYALPTAGLFDVGGGVLFAERYTAGISVSRYKGRESATASMVYTHPAYHPAISAAIDTAPLERTENSVHLSLGYRVPLGRRADLHLFGGPSHVSVEQAFVSDLDTGERFSSATRTWSAYVDDYDSASSRGSVWGYHAGLDAGVRLAPRVSLRGMLRYTGGSADLEEPVLTLIADKPVTTSLKTGGMQALVGLRIGL